MSPALRYSFANGAKYRRGFSSNFLRSSSMRAELAMGVMSAHGGRREKEAARYISSTLAVNQKSRRDLILAVVAG